MVFLTDQAVTMVDAIARMIWRLWGSARNALEWQTAAEAGGGARRAGWRPFSGLRLWPGRGAGGPDPGAGRARAAERA